MRFAFKFPTFEVVTWEVLVFEEPGMKNEMEFFIYVDNVS